MATHTNPLNWPTWAWRAWLALALTVAAFGLIGGTANLLRASGLLQDRGDIGTVLARDASVPPGWLAATAVKPGGAAARAGIEPGDLVRFDLGYATCCEALYPRRVTIQRDEKRFSAWLVPEPTSRLRWKVDLLSGMSGLVTIVLALLLLARGRNNRAAVLLGIVLMPLGSAAVGVPLWGPGDAIARLWAVTFPLADALIGYCWPLFALEVSGGPASRKQERLVHVVASISAVLFFLYQVSVRIVLVDLPILDATVSGSLLIAAHQLFGYGIIASNYRRSSAENRNRAKIVVTAFICFLFSRQLNQLFFLWVSAGYTREQAEWIEVGETVFAYAALVVLVYAVLRKKLFDFNFAVNRTVVYGVVSFILLAGFGLAEWAAKQLVPKAWVDSSHLISAGIALALFLSFHRLRDWVEHHVEKLLFRSWHENEAALRKFVGAAGHFDQAPALCRAFVAELSRFAGGAQAALYMRARDGSHRLCAGKLPGMRKSFAEDDRVFALMRAEREPVKIDPAHTSLPAALALPMLDQGTLTGSAFLARKPDGTDYRPNEVQILGWAAQQVGLDLQAAHARELESEVASLYAKVTSLSEERDRLSRLLAGVTPVKSTPAPDKLISLRANGPT